MKPPGERNVIVEARRELIEEVLAALPPLLGAYRALEDRLRTRLGLNAGQWALLREIARDAPLGIAELARRHGTSRQYVHRLVLELHRVRLIEMARDPADKRVRLVRPTPLAEQRIAEVAQAEADLERALAARFGTEELAVAVSVLARLSDSLSDSGSG